MAELHHVLFPRRLWRAQQPARLLRDTPELLVPMEAGVHTSLHQHIGMVAVPNYCMAEQIKSKFIPVTGNILKSVDKLLFAIDDVKNMYNQNRIEHHLAEIMLIGIDDQRIYLREGL